MILKIQILNVCNLQIAIVFIKISKFFFYNFYVVFMQLDNENVFYLKKKLFFIEYLLSNEKYVVWVDSQCYPEADHTKA